jgi:FdhD protein
MNLGDTPVPNSAGAAPTAALVLAFAVPAQPVHEHVAVETPVAFEVGGISHVVMLATPADLDDFALGFLFTEGLIDSPADLLDVETSATAQGLTLHLRVTARCEARFKTRRRALTGRTGCGLCGTESLAEVRRTQRHVVADAAAQVSMRALSAATTALLAQQPLQHLTGGVHAAAWCALDGRVLVVREDVGRHNALDKLIGALLHARIDVRGGFALITSRASFEMVQKATAAGIGLLAAVSAPTQMAIESADTAGLTLLGFVREGRATAYAHPQRLVEG